MAKAVGASTVTSRFQVTIPSAVRKKFGIHAGDTLVFYEQDGRIYVTTEVKV